MSLRFHDLRHQAITAKLSGGFWFTVAPVFTDVAEGTLRAAYLQKSKMIVDPA